jgi:HEAT repeat protein
MSVVAAALAIALLGPAVTPKGVPLRVPLRPVVMAQSPAQPRITNGRIEPHTVSAGLAKDLPALAAKLTEPTWIGYTAPMIDGEHHMCDYWNDNGRNSYSYSNAPVHLEPPDFFFVLFRVESAQIVRIRTYSADCPLDAGGKAVHWFTNVTSADSLNYLKTFVNAPSSPNRVVDSAVTAIAMHEGQPALDLLIALARDNASTKIRGNALFWLAQRAGQKAVGTITAAIENDPDTEVKKKAVFALSQLPKDEGVPLLIQQARTNKNAAVRKQAMFWLGQSKDPRALKFFEEILR